MWEKKGSHATVGYGQPHSSNYSRNQILGLRKTGGHQPFCFLVMDRDHLEREFSLLLLLLFVLGVTYRVHDVHAPNPYGPPRCLIPMLYWTYFYWGGNRY